MPKSIRGVSIPLGFDHEKFNKSISKAQRSMKRFGKRMQSIGDSMTMGISLPLIGIGTAAVKAAADFEKMQVALNTSFQGNERAAKKAFAEIQEFAERTPFQMAQVMDAFIKLKNMGLDPSQEALTSYGNTAAAMGKDLNQMIEAVADAATGEFERLKEFGIKASSEGDKVKFTFRGVTTEVQKNSAEIQKYLLNIGNTDFAGGMEDMSKTLAGQISTLKDRVTNMAAELGKTLVPAIKRTIDAMEPLLKSMTSAIESFSKLDPKVQGLIISSTAFAVALGPVLSVVGRLVPIFSGMFGIVSKVAPVIGFLGKQTAMMGKSFKVGFRAIKAGKGIFRGLMIALSPVLLKIALITAAIAALGAGAWYVYDNFEAFKQRFVKVWVEVKNKVLGQVAGLTDGLNTMFSALGLDWFDGAAEKILGMTEPVPEVTADFKTFGDSMGNLKDALLNQFQNIKDGAMNMLGSVGEATQKAASKTKKKAKSLFAGKVDAGSVSQGSGSKTRNTDLDPDKYDDDEMKEGLNELAKVAVKTGETIRNAMRTAAVSVGESIGNMIAGTSNFKSFLDGLAFMVADFIVQFGKMAIAAAITAEALQKMFANPIALLAAGIALVAIGTAMSGLLQKGPGGGKKAPALAEGGLAYGPTMAVVGDNPNAGADPEVISPLSKLKKMIGNTGQSNTTIVNLDGRTIWRNQEETGLRYR